MGFFYLLVDLRGHHVFAKAKTFPRGVASKNPKQVLDFRSAPTAYEPTVLALQNSL